MNYNAFPFNACSLIKNSSKILIYENILKTQKMNLKPVIACDCEDTCIIYRSKLYLNLVKHGLWSLVWLTLNLVHFIRPNSVYNKILVKSVTSFLTIERMISKARSCIFACMSTSTAPFDH